MAYSLDPTVPNGPRLEFLTPRVRTGPRVPLAPVVGLGLWVVAFLASLSSAVHALWIAGGAWLQLVGLFSACWLTSWADARVYQHGRTLKARKRTLLHVALPLVVTVGAPLAAWILDQILRAIGYGPDLLLALLVCSVWLVSASVGTLVIVVLDASVRVIPMSFRRRTQLFVLLLLAISCAVTLVVGPRAFALLSAAPSMTTALRSSTTARLASALALAPLLRSPSSGQFVFILAIVVGLPSMLSATSKFAGLLMERIYPLSDAFDEVAKGSRTVRVTERGNDELAQLSRHFNDMMERLSRAESMERAFGTYVSPQVLDRIRAQHGKAQLPASTREATVLFCDIRGFTSLSERLAPAAVMEVLNRFFARAVDVIDSHDGYLNKFVGDAVLVVFNGPIDQPDHVARALHCAMGLQRVVAQLNAVRGLPHVERIDIGVGVATGPMICGTVGGPRQMEFTVIGDVVNTASRLCSRAAGGEIWVNRAACDARPADVQVTSLQAIAVKGRSGAVEAAQILLDQRVVP